MSTKNDLIKIAAKILMTCPVSSYLEDMELPCK
jgi:hypothetical protein